MGGGGRADAATGTTGAVGEGETGSAVDLPSLVGRPGPVLAAAVESAADPVRGSWPVGSLPVGASSEPLAQVIHAVVGARRLAGWALWAQLSMIARLVVAWQTSPPVSNHIGVGDRCAEGEESDPALVERLNTEIGRLQRAAGGRLGDAGPWGMAAEMAPLLASAELSLACGLSRTGADRHVDAAEALFVQGRLPRLRRLLRSGWVEWAKVDWFVRDTAHLDIVVARAVERMVLGDLDPAEDLDVLADPAQPGLGLPGIVTMTVPQLRAAIAAAVVAIDAEAAERAARNARSARRVRCEVNQDGTATVSAELAVEAAAAVWNALTAAAKAAKAAGDPRSLDQLRADELLARATGTALPPPAPGDTLDDEPAADMAGDADPDSATVDPDSATAAPDSATDEPTDAGSACHACGQEPGKARVQRTGRPVNVSLTLPLSSYLGLAADPGRLDGFGPVAAAVARQIIRDAARNNPDGGAGITWRCVVVDDVHGTVLGVGVPLRVSKHDPPPRLADLVRAGEPTCCFPGCRIRARDCDLDHRIPYNPDDPGGDRGGGVTCSCNLQPLCRGHHRLKTAGLIGVRTVSESEEPGVVPGSLEFTSATGLRYRRPPTPATPRAADLDDPQIALAVTHAQLRTAQDADDEAAMNAQHAASEFGYDGYDGYDGQDRAWRRSLHDHTRRRIRDAAANATTAAGRRAGALDPPPF